MIKLQRRVSRGLLLVIAISILTFFYCVSYSGSYRFRDDLSGAMKMITQCHHTDPIIFPKSLSPMETNIPNVIHQIWKSENVRTYPGSVEASLNSWMEVSKPLNYTVRLWTDSSVLQLVNDKYPWLLNTYKSYPQDIQRADLARLLIIHAEGGIYADLDVFPSSIRSIQCLQRCGLHAIFASTAGTSHGISNHFFMAQQGSLFLEWTLYEAKRRGSPSSWLAFLPYLQVFWSTGPMMLTTTFTRYAWMFDYYLTSAQDIALLDRGYSQHLIRHAAGRSWHGRDGRFLNYAADHLAICRRMVFLVFLLFLLGFIYKARRRCYRLLRLL